MNPGKALHETSLKSLKFLHRGKVRDLYEIDADRMLIVQTDRLSAFDVILPTPIPGKGARAHGHVEFLVPQAGSRNPEPPARCFSRLGRFGKRAATRSKAALSW